MPPREDANCDVHTRATWRRLLKPVQSPTRVSTSENKLGGGSWEALSDVTQGAGGSANDPWEPHVCT